MAGWFRNKEMLAGINKRRVEHGEKPWVDLPPATTRVFKGIKGYPSHKRMRYGFKLGK